MILEANGQSWPQGRVEEPHGDEHQVALALWLKKISGKIQAAADGLREELQGTN